MASIHHHELEHDHHDRGQDTTSFTEQNRSHWDKSATSYSSEPWQRDMLNKIHDFMLSNISWIGVDFIDPSTAFEAKDSSSPRKIRVLDYACGPGTVTNVIYSHATEFVGIDLSQNMVEVYNNRFKAVDGGEASKAHAVVGDLLDAEDPNPKLFTGSEYFDFDLVAVGLGFHHFQNLEEATKRFANRLKSGGIFLIIDLVTHAKWDDDNPAIHTVAHNGFGGAEIQKIFESAGLVDIDVVRMQGEVMIRGTHPRTPFMGKGRKL